MGEALSEAELGELQKENEKLRRENEELRQRVDALSRGSLIGTQPDFIFHISAEGVFLDYHAADPSMLYVPSSTFVGKNIREVLPPSVAELCMAATARALATGELQSFEYTLPKDGKEHVYESYVTPTRGGTVLTHIRDFTGNQERAVELRRSEELLHAVMRNMPLVMFALDREGVFTLSEGRALESMGLAPGEVVGKNVFELFREVPGVCAELRRVLEEGAEVRFPSSNTDWAFENWSAPIRGLNGAIVGALGVSLDVTERRKASEEQSRLQAELLRAQESALRELSTPLIPIADEVVAMPLIGTIDQARAGQVMEVLLHGITSQRAQVAILDVTGVTEMNAEVAGALMGAARAAMLLGAEVVLSGIQPSIAQTLVALDIDLSRVKTYGTLKEGISYALTRRRHGRSK